MRSRSRIRSSMIMKPEAANALVSAFTAWALAHEDIRAMALVGSWARVAVRSKLRWLRARATQLKPRP